MSRERIVIAPTAATAEERAATAHHATRRGFTRLLVRDAADLTPPEGAAILTRDETSVRGEDGVARPIVAVRDPSDLGVAGQAGRRAGGVVIAWSAERVIPLENLIAEAHGRYPVWVIVDRLRDLPAMLGALEHGADTVVVEVASPADVDAVESALDEISTGRIPWELAEVTRSAAAGLGDRVIVDTTSLLGPKEGMLIGSSAAYLFHVVSEAVGSRFTRPRPFRVNAGAPHSYALLADGTTRYLSELVPGDAILVAEPEGRARSVRVGRLKIERRPMVLVEVAPAGRAHTVFLQEAETVRLSGEHEAIPTTHLHPGTRVYGARFPPARHLGGVVEETIDER